ncbi:MAG: hypothetical protein ACXWQO_04020 [Bdellovibrionota bacterium]
MKHLIKISALLMLLILPTGYATAANPAATNAFEELKALKGEWKSKGEGEVATVTYEVRSNGHSLVETMDDMVSVYHLDGDSIMMTHYCSAGNQPRLRAVDFTSPLQKLVFQFVDGTNLQPGGHNINGLTIEFLSPNLIKETWTSAGNEGEATAFELERVK